MSVYRFATEWCANASNPGSAETKSRRWASVNVYYRGRTIYSYGEHFPMGYMLAPGLIWLNGDRVSNTTSRHQSQLRAAAQRANLTALIIPGSALDGAGIDYRTLQPVHIQSERFESISHESDTAPTGLITTVPRYRYISTGERFGSVSVTFDDSGRPISAMTGEPIDGYVGYVNSENRQCAVMNHGGRYHWHTIRHWLGDSVFTAVVDRTFDGTVGPRTYWISSFDRQETRPLYFLSQLPGPADTVDDAIELLAPDSVKTARDIGRNVIRQGDIFAIESELSTRALRAAGARFTRRSVTVEYSLDSRRRIRVRDTLQEIVEEMPKIPDQVYFGAELSRGAFESLRNWREDRVNEWTDTVIKRYADRYPAESKWADIRSSYSIDSFLRYSPRAWDKTRNANGEPILGTAHTATQVATLPSGLQYARGCLYHEPDIIGESRARDHIRRALGRKWHLVTRNTVPVSGPGRRRSVA